MKVKIDEKRYSLPELPENGQAIAVSELPGTDNMLIFSLTKDEHNVERIHVYRAEKTGDCLELRNRVGVCSANKSKEMYNIYHYKVSDRYQKKGIGETLLTLARERAIAHNSQEISFPAGIEHEKKTQFYQERGLKPKEVAPYPPFRFQHRAKPEEVKPTTHLNFKWVGRRKK